MLLQYALFLTFAAFHGAEITVTRFVRSLSAPLTYSALGHCICFGEFVNFRGNSILILIASNCTASILDVISIALLKVRPFSVKSLFCMPLDTRPHTKRSRNAWLKKSPLAKVYDYVRNGWPSTLSEGEKELKSFIRSELTTESGCILRNERVIIPPVFQNYVINELRQGHPGMVRMKSLARMRVWWPNIDDDIEKKVRSCSSC